MEEKTTRVLHIVKVMNHGGAETMIMNLYRNIEREKVQFDFLYLSNESGEYDREIINLGGRIYKVQSPENGRIKNMKEIFKLLKTQKFSIIHSHISYYSGFVCLIAYMAGVKKRITHSHTTNDLREKGIIRVIYNKIAKFLIKIFSNVKLSCGIEAGKYLYGKNKFTVINNGIDLEKYKKITSEEIYKLKKELKIDENKIIFGHVGRFVNIKNQEYFIKFAKVMLKYRKDFIIILVGQGSNLEKIKNLIEKNNLQKYFVLTGLREDIPMFMKMFDVFIMPSLYEGFPLVIVEALAGGNICFLSDKISKETNIINSRVNFFSLDDNIDNLCKEIIEKLKQKKELDVYDILEKKGFTNNVLAKKIQNIYLN